MPDEKKTMSDALEVARCAQINCDNVASVGLAMLPLVKMQIDEVVQILENIERIEE